MGQTIHGSFLEAGKTCWNQKLSLDAHTDTELTYGKCAVGARLLSTLLKSKTSSQFVSILLPPCGGSFIAILGTLFSSKTPVMINYSTGVLSNIDIARKKCKTDLVLTSKRFIEKLNIEPTDEMLFLEDAVSGFSTLQKLISLVMVRFLPSSWFSKLDGWTTDESAISVILFTSGSEKEPKAVPLTHKNVLTTITGAIKAISLSKDDVLLATLPVFHSFGFLSAFLFALNKTKIVFYPNPLDYKTIGKVSKANAPTVMLGPPTFYEGYISKCDKDDFKSVRIAISGADKLLEKTRSRFFEKFGVKIFQGYGVTESCAAATIETKENSRPNSVGKVFNNMEIKIVHPETEKTLPQNTDGLILLKGDNVMSGYFGDEEKTKETIKNSWYYTGDIGRLDNDGFLWISGRMKRFVKIGGEMISLAMVEVAISECLPDDCECAVVGIDDVKRGSKIQAVVTSEKDIIPSLKKQLQKTIPALAIPKEFQVIDEIPKLGSGKPDYRKLQNILQSK